MLSRNFVYNADDTATGNATSTPTPDTQQATNGSNAGEKVVEEKLFTQADLNRIAAKEAKDAKAKALENVLKDLGIEDLNQAKAIIEAQKKKEDAEKTAAQKLAEQLQALQAQLESEKQERAKIELQSKLDKRDSSVLALLVDARNPSDVLALLKLRHSNLDNLMDESGKFDAVEADKIIAEFRKDNPYQFKDTKSPGSPSNAGGKFLNPQDKVVQEVQAELRRKTQL